MPTDQDIITALQWERLYAHRRGRKDLVDKVTAQLKARGASPWDLRRQTASASPQTATDEPDEARTTTEPAPQPRRRRRSPQGEAG